MARGAAVVGARSHGAATRTRTVGTATQAGMAGIGAGAVAGTVQPARRRAHGQAGAVTGSRHNRSRAVKGAAPVVGRRITEMLGAVHHGRTARKSTPGAGSSPPSVPTTLVAPTTLVVLTTHAGPPRGSGQDVLLGLGVALWVGKARAAPLLDKADGVSGATSAPGTVHAYPVIGRTGKAVPVSLEGPGRASSAPVDARQPKDTRQVTAGNAPTARRAATAAHGSVYPRGSAAARSAVAAGPA